eukprot:9335798-Lingulodinium_polyedra.AAC.1
MWPAGAGRSFACERRKAIVGGPRDAKIRPQRQGRLSVAVRRGPRGQPVCAPSTFTGGLRAPVQPRQT